MKVPLVKKQLLGGVVTESQVSKACLVNVQLSPFLLHCRPGLGPLQREVRPDQGGTGKPNSESQTCSEESKDAGVGLRTTRMRLPMRMDTRWRRGGSESARYQSPNVRRADVDSEAT